MKFLKGQRMAYRCNQSAINIEQSLRGEFPLPFSKPEQQLSHLRKIIARHKIVSKKEPKPIAYLFILIRDILGLKVVQATEVALNLGSIHFQMWR